MQFIKKNYEKVLLGIVLFGLVAVAVMLLLLVSTEKARLEELSSTVITFRVEALPPVDLSWSDIMLKRASSTAAWNFADNQHKLLNPQTWGRAQDQRLVKLEVGGKALQKLEIVKVTPLYLTISFENVSIPSPDAPPLYAIGLTDEAASKPANRYKKTIFGRINEKKDMFAVRAVGGPPENPTNLVLELLDSGTRIAITREKAFRRIEGHSADLKYPPENRAWPGRRKDDAIAFAGENYTIANVNSNEVILQAKSNQQKWTIKFNPVPEPRQLP